MRRSATSNGDRMLRCSASYRREAVIQSRSVQIFQHIHSAVRSTSAFHRGEYDDRLSQTLTIERGSIDYRGLDGYARDGNAPSTRSMRSGDRSVSTSIDIRSYDLTNRLLMLRRGLLLSCTDASRRRNLTRQPFCHLHAAAVFESVQIGVYRLPPLFRDVGEQLSVGCVG